MNAPIQLNLVFFVTETLRKQGHKRPDDWAQDLHPDAYTEIDVSKQRFLINRTLRNMLGRLDVSGTNTMDIRYSLFDNGTTEDWCSQFDKYVAPFIILHDLPIKLTV